MSDTEKKLVDTHGQYLVAVEGGERRTDASWQPCRIVITIDRIALIAGDTRQIRLSAIDRVDDLFEDPRATGSVADYVVLGHDEEVVLLTGKDHAAFETALYGAFLDGELAFVKHPAVEGGVVRDTAWTRARMSVAEGTLRFTLEEGQTVSVVQADIGGLEAVEKRVAGERRTVLEVEHAQDDISVETHVASEPFHARVLTVMLGESADRNRANLDLSNTELRVVMALHSGVSPFDIPSFVGIEVEECEALFDRLIEFDVIDVVRERTEVRLTPQGRRVAGETMRE